AGQALLQSGEVDAFAGDASVLTGWVQPDGSLESGRLLPNVISVEPLAIALPKGQQYDTLKTEIDRLLRRWYAEEWLQAQMEYWGLPSGVLPSMLQHESSLNPLDE
ncbi:MAG: transporter substrate-binding domain-containing protein, partial [Cyanobacteria bacterium J06553_1]